MDCKTQRQKLRRDELWQEISAQQNIETEITLPDYCSDIKRILKCILRPGINNISLSGENVNATGKISIKLIYVSEKDKIDCYEGSEDLHMSAIVKDMPENAVISAEAKVNYVNCRAVSQRKISIEGNNALVLKFYCEKSKELPENIEGAGVQCRRRELQYEDLICRKEKVFDMGETAKVPQGKAPVGKILRVSSRATLESKKAVADKLLIKGDLYTDILYLSEDEEGKVDKITHSMPISQIVDMPGIDEDSLCSVIFKVRQVSVQRKADSSSQGRLVEIAAKCSAMVRCSQIKTAYVIDDCYSISNHLKSEYSLEEFTFPVHTMSEQKTVACNLDMPTDISEVLDVWCSDLKSDMKGKENKAKANCNIALGVLYLDSKGVPNFSEKNADFEIDCKLKDSYESLRCTIDTQVRNIDWKITGKDKLEVKIKVGVISEISSSDSVRVLKDVKVTEESKNTEDTALTLYFCNKGEEIWDIAKKYNTTKEAICTENSIGGDVTEKEEMILIPWVG